MGSRLEEYKRKRDFKTTEEPSGQVMKSGERLRFVVQKHAASRLHYDFRLEWDGVLLSWAVPKGPSFNPKDKRLAVEVEPHPMDYRDFEGNIPKEEYGGGTVMLFDEGFWAPQEDMEKGLKEGSIKMILSGERMKGKWALVRMKSKASEKDTNWLLIKEKDEYVREEDGIGEFITSIRTGRTMEEIRDEVKNQEKVGKMDRKGLPFTQAKVELAKLSSDLPLGDDWIYELKYDGYRILAFLDRGKVRLMTRNHMDYTDKFPDIREELEILAVDRDMVLDGEIVVLDHEGRTDFQALQSYIRKPKGKNLRYIIFDLLAYEEEDYRDHGLKIRKEKLSSIIPEDSPYLHYSSHTRGDGKEVLKAACAAGMEGVICKKENSEYRGDRSGDWIKVKCEKRQEFVVGGYTLSDKRQRGISSLLLGVYEGKELIYSGRAGTGFPKKVIEVLLKEFKPLLRKTSPFKIAPEKRTEEEIFFLTPKLVAEIRFQEWTDENLLRQASFKGLRSDKDPQEVIREKEDLNEDQDEEESESQGKSPVDKGLTEPGGTEERAGKTGAPRKSMTLKKIRVTSPDKEMYGAAGVTKEDVALYYDKVHERMQPYVTNRILSLLRCPEGISGECFYQKHVEKPGKGMEKIAIEEKSGENEDYLYIKDVTGMISAVQMGTLEFHTWGSRIPEIEFPDMMVFDLDPAEGMDIGTVRQGVRDMKEILDELSLTSFLKTSGGKGYHVVVPLNATSDWEVVREFAKLCAQAMEERWPDRYTSNMRKEKRKGKIFIDWVRNGRSATSVAAYSLRAREGAPVSMPILWEELDDVLPNGIRLKDALERLKKEDPWKDFFSSSQGLKETGLSPEE